MNKVPGSLGVLAAVGLAALLPACGGGEGSGSGTTTTGGSGTIAVQIHGEEIATDGFAFPTGSEVTIADGWEITFSHVLVNVDKVWLSENPDKAPSDQSQMGAVVAETVGPWAIDLHKAGTATAAGGGVGAVPLFTFDSQNKKGDAPLAAGERYAFSYATAAASDGAELVNFEGDAEAKALYDEMKVNGYAVYYVGKATWKGTDCQSSDPAYDFGSLPTSVDFKLGFATPSEYLNCQNQDNQGDPFEGEEYQRGVPIKENSASVAQMTFHLEHPLFSSVVHDSNLYFDQLVAPLAGQPQGTPLTMDVLTGQDPEGFTDGAGLPLPWRSCDGSALPASKQRYFETGSVPVDPKASPQKALRDYRDFVAYVQSTQGHLNGGEGLCFTKRNYPSPP